MTKDFLEKIKNKLTEDKLHIEKELSAFAHRNSSSKDVDFVTNYVDVGNDLDDNASEIAQYGDNLSIEGEFEKSLRDIEKALKTLEDGTYGKCKYCKAQIDEARLEARPDSSSCINCKKTFTKET